MEVAAKRAREEHESDEGLNKRTRSQKLDSSPSESALPLKTLRSSKAVKPCPLSKKLLGSHQGVRHTRNSIVAQEMTLRNKKVSPMEGKIDC